MQSGNCYAWASKNGVSLEGDFKLIVATNTGFPSCLPSLLRCRPVNIDWKVPNTEIKRITTWNKQEHNRDL